MKDYLIYSKGATHKVPGDKITITNNNDIIIYCNDEIVTIGREDWWVIVHDRPIPTEDNDLPF